MALSTPLIVDKSAWVRAADAIYARVWDALNRADLTRMCDVTALEVQQAATACARRGLTSD